MLKSKGLYDRAKGIIPGGTQLLSKRPEMFLPDQWPAYFKKAKGVEIWDLDNRKYLDMGIMAIGASPLGYANPYVSKAVKRAIDRGCISSLNSIEEVQLAEKLIELHPYTEMVRFSRTGGEADAIAVRIARAASGKTKVAVCGYHGWHDWYLATNISNSNNLNDLLLPGLSPVGVPPELKGTTLPFHYGNIKELQSIVEHCGKDLGVIVVEVQRYKEADVPFLTQVRAIANKLNAVLIFDEVSSSFRQTVGGIYKKYGLEPDVVVLGKALGNGHPISAILGKKDVMEAAQDTFISSSYWTERVGFVAALEVIDQFEKSNVIEYLEKMGRYLDAGFQKIFGELKLSIRNIGMVPVPILEIQEQDSLLVKTVFTQEMLEKNFLVSNVIYLSYAHTKETIDHYLDASYRVFTRIKKGIEEENLKELLKGPVCHSGFSRLT